MRKPNLIVVGGDIGARFCRETTSTAAIKSNIFGWGHVKNGNKDDAMQEHVGRGGS